jgi:hypothetical protein
MVIIKIRKLIKNGTHYKKDAILSSLENSLLILVFTDVLDAEKPPAVQMQVVPLYFVMSE